MAYTSRFPTLYLPVHPLAAEVFETGNVVLADADRQSLATANARASNTEPADEQTMRASLQRALAAGLMTISEVAFDADHRFAAISYRFYCGPLCGNSATRLFQKEGGEWKPMGKPCERMFYD